MMTAAFQDKPQINWLPDGKRLQMRHGPIDLVLMAEGNLEDVQRGYRQAASAFKHVLNELSSELSLLRSPLGQCNATPDGSVAKNMVSAASRITSRQFVTPMIAVAGAVADHILANLIRDTKLSRAFVNNGGDIAIHLAPGESFDVGVCSDPISGVIASTARITSDAGVGGIATSGWRGRSHSLGIVDAVTVFAHNAAVADTAATLIANEVDLPDHPAIARQPANALSPDSDLGSMPVTVDVSPLSQTDIEVALYNGRCLGQELVDKGQIIAVFGNLQSEMFSLERDRQTIVTENPNIRKPLTIMELAHA